MDTKISQKVIQQRERKRLWKFILSGIIIIIIICILINIFRSGIDLQNIDTSVVDRGPVEITVEASGKVAPLYEEIITSPISSKILEVFKKSGELLHDGDLILRLDLDATNADFERQKDELEMKKNKIEQQRLNAQTQLSETAMQVNIDSLQLQRLQVLLRNEHYLDSIGASTPNKIRQVELELQVQFMQYDQLKLKYTNLQKTALADVRVLELDYNIGKKNFGLASKTVGDAQVRASRTATLTWVNDQVGSAVTLGSQLAIVSDLTHFKVETEVADSYADKIKPGNKAIVKIGDKELTGRVGYVVPAVTDGRIKFTVTLDQSDNQILRSGLEVDVFIINSIQNNVLRIAKRSYYVGPGDYKIWVIENGTAHKRNVKLGESSYDRVVVIDGLNEGEMLINSDMSQYMNESTLKIR